MLFDTHCHAYWDSLSHRHAEVRENMRAAGVSRTVQIGADWDTSIKALQLARDWGDGHWATAGLHPSDCQDFPEHSAQAWASQLEKHIQSNRDKVIAVGECGLDYYHLTPGKEATQKQTQRAFFAAQVALAERLKLPLIIHSRESAVDTLSLVRDFKIKRAVIHCFCENWDFARAMMEISPEIVFAFGGTLTYKKSTAIQEAAKWLPLDRIVLETDAPFLVPQIARDTFTVNEPAFVRHVMDFFKTLRSERPDIIEQAIWDNSNRFFGVAN